MYFYAIIYTIMLQNDWNIKIENESKIKRTKVIISLALATCGLLVIASQAIPLVNSYLNGVITQKREEVKVEPVSEEYKTYIENEFAFYDPGKSYFANLSEQLVLGASTSSSAKNIVIDTEYSKPMYITINNVGITNIKITPNVESADENIYNKYLKSGVAHFKGTPLPGDGGNSFIYGHSAVASFFNSHKDLPETIFSRLENIDVGDEINIVKDDTTYTYVVRSKKIVTADDFTILETTSNKESVTLMTCWPLGIGTKRLVVYAERRN